MRSGIENWLIGHWYGAQVPPWYLRMFEPLYRSAFKRAQKRQLASVNENQAGLPLIVVGNITVGGSGKTPLVIRLCQLASELGLKTGIASTGYGRQSQETIHVHTDSETGECGDEPVLLAQRTGMPVVVAASRLDAVRSLNEMDLDLIFSDDGLQHTDLGANIEICVVDGHRGLGNGHLLPAGPLREPVARLRVVDHVVTNGEWPGKPDGLTVNVMQLEAKEIRSLDDSQACPVGEFQETHGGSGIHAFAGIGNPGRFFNMLQTLGIDVETHAFADHHNFRQPDFVSAPAGAAILMTEKDAVKCRSLGLKNAWYVPVEAHLSPEFERILKDRITSLIEDSQK